MPLFEGECLKCRHEYEYVQCMKNSHIVDKCPICKGKGIKVIRNAPVVRPDLNDWCQENNGKGRFNKQLMTHCKDRNDAISKAKARGWGVLDKM